MEMKTWTDLEKLAIGLPWEPTPPTRLGGEPILYQALRAVERGALTREQALIQAVFALVTVKTALTEQLIHEVSLRPLPPFLLPKD